LETLIDSSVLLDLFTEDRDWLGWSQEELIRAGERGALVLNAVILAEISPRFPRVEELSAALPSMAIIEEIPLGAAFLAGHAHADYRRAGGTREAVLPDFLIGAHAAITARPLLTRDPWRIATYIPGAKLITPPERR
jgi:predicted nucleic acid-binding protein